MPTAAEYDLWAWGLNDRGDELTGLMAPAVAMATPEVLSGGMVSVTVDLATRAALANSLAAAGLLRQLADECVRRAEICRQYELDMLAFEQRSSAYRSAIAEYGRQAEAAAAAGTTIGSPPWPPTEPARPHPWVER